MLCWGRFINFLYHFKPVYYGREQNNILPSIKNIWRLYLYLYLYFSLMIFCRIWERVNKQTDFLKDIFFKNVLIIIFIFVYTVLNILILKESPTSVLWFLFFFNGYYPFSQICNFSHKLYQKLVSKYTFWIFCSGSWKRLPNPSLAAIES